MPSPKSGRAGRAVAPIEPKKPEEADKGNPGEMVRRKTQQAKPFKPPEEEQEGKTWIEIKLVDENDEPVLGERYRITLPDGSVDEGTLDEQRSVRIEGIDPGTCQVTFPNLDKNAWERI